MVSEAQKKKYREVMAEKGKNGGLHDLGEKGITSKEDAASEAHYPSMTLTDKRLPGLKGCEIGSKKRLMVEVVVDGINLRDEEARYDLKFKAAKVMSGKDPMAEDENEAGEE